ncbi:ZINC KNUCKLE CX2CX4HX4C-RELATED [Salix viminalis]|uniref:ZINC KNUCKLE CX2CX4HX4C-RELATED n=1 Tax=Salix viminalis TaxID=40686 RepID=A0A9Q0UGT4_SALVM|nr:ZINC KNUCKLE CX2CX4HX4C-RELATED [Salix viminalis]
MGFLWAGTSSYLSRWIYHLFDSLRKRQFQRSKVSKLPVWIRLKGLPIPLWTKQGLSLAASMVQKPLSCDEHTITCKRLEYARLCVELDARLPFVHHFDVESPLSEEPLRVNVEYEWKPSRCERCGSFGHSCVQKGVEPTQGKPREDEGQRKMEDGPNLLGRDKRPPLPTTTQQETYAQDTAHREVKAGVQLVSQEGKGSSTAMGEQVT